MRLKHCKLGLALLYGVSYHLEYAISTKHPSDSVGTYYEIHQGTLSDLNWVDFNCSPYRKALRVFDINCELNQADSRYEIQLCLSEQELPVRFLLTSWVEVQRVVDRLILYLLHSENRLASLRNLL